MTKKKSFFDMNPKVKITLLVVAGAVAITLIIVAGIEGELGNLLDLVFDAAESKK